MSISLINTAMSALDTPSSLLPFFIKDAFDVTGRTIMAQNEGGKHEAREKFIEEAGTSLFWIGGIPAVRAIANKIAKNQLDTDIHFKRINSSGIQNYYADKLVETGKGKGKEKGKEITKNKFSKEDLDGIVLSGKKLGEIQEKLSKSGFVPNGPKGTYKNFHVGVSVAGVLINLFMLTVALPKFNQFLSRKIISKEVKEEKENFGKTPNKKEHKNASFGSLKDFVDFKNLFNFTQMAENAQLNATSSMLLLDYGISGSRVTFIPRNNNERIEYAVKEGGIILFFYYAADLIKAGLAKLANKAINTPIDLDYKIIQSKEFLNKLKNPHKKEDILKFPEISKEDEKSELKVIKFIDQELLKASKDIKKEAVFENFTLEMAQKEGLIDVEYDDGLNKWIRNSKKYIKTDKIIELNSNLKNFYEKAFTQIKNVGSSTNIENIITKTKKIKMASIFANIAICCASLSFILPKIQYMIREHRTQTKSAPGIKLYQEMAEKNMI